MAGRDKIFFPLGGYPLLAYAVTPFQESRLIRDIVLVLNRNNLKKGQELADKQCWSKVAEICLGGERRQDSVTQGLRRLKDCEWVFIHDGARPFVDQEMIHRGLEAAQETGAAIAAVPVKETVKVAQAGVVQETLPRQNLWVVQTPQVFRFDIITSAYEQASKEVTEATDDAMLVERSGYKVKLYAGSYDNIKITTPQDLQLAKAILRGRSRAF
jgi:2-C-methyl-D-erythritol 4-phosphate cytidylyltransferase